MKIKKWSFSISILISLYILKLLSLSDISYADTWTITIPTSGYDYNWAKGISVHPSSQSVYTTGTRYDKAWIAKFTDPKRGERVPQLVWEKLLDNTMFKTGRGISSGEDIVVDETDTYVYVIGTYWVGSVRTDSANVFIAQLDAGSGSVIWYTTLDVAGLNDEGLGIAISPAGDIFITGRTYNTTWSTPAASASKNIFFAKYSPWRDHPDWFHIFDNTTTTSSYYDEGHDILYHSDNFLYLTGDITIRAAAGTSKRLLTIKIDPDDGDIIWKTISETWTSGNDITEDIDGNLWVVGTERGDILIQQYDPDSGTIISSTRRDGPARSIDLGYGIVGLPTGGIAYTGFLSMKTEDRFTSSWNQDIFVYTPYWKDTIDGSAKTLDWGFDIDTDDEGYIYVVGFIFRLIRVGTEESIARDILIRKYAPDGVTEGWYVIR